MQKKRILFLITKGVWGGAQKYVYDLATGLPTNEYDVAVAVGTAGPLIEKIKQRGIRLIQIEKLQRDVFMFSRARSVSNPVAIARSIAHEIHVLRELIRVLKTEQPHVLHVSSSKAAGLGMFACRLFTKNIRGIFTVHGWGFLENRGFATRMLFSFLSWLTALLAHTVILVSQNDCVRAEWMPFVQKKFIVIHNGIAPPDFLSPESAKTALLGHISEVPNHDAIWCGTISELTPNKGLSYLIDACAKLRKENMSFVYFVIGTGEEKEKLEARIKERELSARVFLLGFLPDASRYLRAFDIFSLTSVKEGLPYVILEAGHAGTAVAASNIGGIPEIISDMQSGLLIKPKNTTEIASALRYLIENKNARTSFGAMLQKIVSGRFSITDMRKKTYAQYENKI